MLYEQPLMLPVSSQPALETFQHYISSTTKKKLEDLNKGHNQQSSYLTAFCSFL